MTAILAGLGLHDRIIKLIRFMGSNPVSWLLPLYPGPLLEADCLSPWWNPETSKLLLSAGRQPVPLIYSRRRTDHSAPNQPPPPPYRLACFLCRVRCCGASQAGHVHTSFRSSIWRPGLQAAGQQMVSLPSCSVTSPWTMRYTCPWRSARPPIRAAAQS